MPKGVFQSMTCRLRKLVRSRVAVRHMEDPTAGENELRIRYAVQSRLHLAVRPHNYFSKCKLQPCLWSGRLRLSHCFGFLLQLFQRDLAGGRTVHHQKLSKASSTLQRTG